MWDMLRCMQVFRGKYEIKNMSLELKVNGKKMLAERGETVLEVLRRNGIAIPTLCHMEDLTPTGACRLCVVELQGSDPLIPACSLQAAEGMDISTHSPNVLLARRRTVELLLSSHPQDCLFCLRNGQCQLQDLAAEFQVHQRRLPPTFRARKSDNSSESIIIEPSKCILCERCIRTCNEIMEVGAIELCGKGTNTILKASSPKGLYKSPCISCGQCTLVCPTAAIHEKESTEQVREALYREDITTSVSFTPEVGASLGELLGIRPGKNIAGLLPALMRTMGFDKVLNGGLGTDINISLQSELLKERSRSKEARVLYSSSCPAWIAFAEKNHPGLLSNLSPIPHPQELMAALTRSEKTSEKNIRTYHVAVAACTALKQEILKDRRSQPAYHIDAVLTVRELARLVVLLGIDVQALEDELPDDPFEHYNYTSAITGMSGGTAEALAREFYYRMSGEELNNAKISKIRSSRDVKEIKIRVEKKEYGFMAINGIANFNHAVARIKGDPDLIFVEVMACPGGCVNGGGQPIHPDDTKVKARGKSLADSDARNSFRAAPRIALLEKLHKAPLFDKLEFNNLSGKTGSKGSKN